MNLSKAVAKNLGKAFLNIGQGVILASLVSGFFGRDISLPMMSLGIGVGAYTIYLGLWFISESENSREGQ